MRFTLIITTYNSECFVENAIQSALNQSKKPDEIIICDDNSSDKTIEICKKYSDDLIIHINEKGPSGYTGAFNYALELGTGDYVTILHFDDVLHPEFLYQAELGFSKYPSCRFLITQNFYFKEDNCNFIHLDEKEETFLFLKGKDYAKSYLNGVRTNKHINRCPGTIFHRTLVKEIKFREEAGLISDDDLFYRVGGLTDVVRIIKPLAGVRSHAESETAKLDPLKLSYALSQGYSFMAKDWNEESVIGHEGRMFFLESFCRHNFHALYWASLHKKLSEVKSAVKLNHEMRYIFNNNVKKYSKPYQWFFFLLAENKLFFINKTIFSLHYHISNWRKRHS
jgi:glycosyltransferase involved in cell wall biosynthesis